MLNPVILQCEPLESEPETSQNQRHRQTTKAIAKTAKVPQTTLPLPPPLVTSSRGTPFERAVWCLTYQIPAGSFSTYALLSAHLKSSPRAVGNALRRNPFAPEIPWLVHTHYHFNPPPYPPSPPLPKYQHQH
jgi:O6-methylguanine-DNA--protein-cysteine methyltransferase